MGRETKILLGFLGLLAGAFVGVLSMKLLVPRPPTGAGPDVHADLAVDAPHDIVEPPARTMPTSAFAAAPPLVPATTPGEAAMPNIPTATGGDRYAARSGGFGSAAHEPPADAEPRLPHRDPFVTAAAFEQPEDASPTDPAARTAADGAADVPQPMPPDANPAADEPVATLPTVPAVEPLAAPAALAGGHVARPGDTWWSIAERAYGDGRLYRALFAWNRAVDPRVTLAPGTPLEIPPLAALGAAWPHLLPARP